MNITLLKSFDCQTRLMNPFLARRRFYTKYVGDRLVSLHCSGINSHDDD